MFKQRSFEIFLIYLLGGLLGLISGLVVLRFLHLFDATGQNHAFIYHVIYPLMDEQSFAYTVTVIAVFVLLGITIADAVLKKNLLSAQKGRIKDLEESNQTKTELVSFVSHQLRTPLAALRWSGQMLLDGDYGSLSGDQEDIVKRIYEKAKNLDNLIVDFLDVSKLELDRLEISPKYFNLSDLEKEIQNIIVELEPLMQNKNIEFRREIKINKSDFLFIDIKRINQVIESFLENAINYTPVSGKIELIASSDARNFLLSVSDSGIGIPEGDKLKIFNKFFRAINARELRSAGTGIGLYLCKKFIDVHRGKIWFVSKEGKGATFSISLPLKARVDVEELFRRI